MSKVRRVQVKRGHLERRCRFCSSTDLHLFLDLGITPLANNYLTLTGLHQMEPHYPLRVYVCENCLLVQLDEFQKPEDIFSNYAYFSSYSDSWLEHARSYVEGVVERFCIDRDSQVVEIGSNDGYLLQHFVVKGVAALGIEPAENVAQVAIQKGIPTIQEFFGEQTARRLVSDGIRADLLIGNNVLAHIPELNGFLTGMKTLLKHEGVLTMEFPHLMCLMDGNQFDTIYHEHVFYFSFMTVEKIFASHNLTIFDVEQLSTHGGSLRIYSRHDNDYSKPITKRVADLKAVEKAAGLNELKHYLGFSEKVKETKRKILDFLSQAKRRGKVIVGYGAPAKANTLLNYCGVSSSIIDYTVDRNPHKQGHFLPGTHIPIYEPDRIKRTKPDYVLLLAWNLREEIMKQTRYVRDWKGKFVVPIPELKVFS